MYKDKIIAAIAVIMNNPKLIVIKSMPDSIDKIVIIDDYSTDNTITTINLYI